MLHPATELRFVSPEIGYGVFATAPIPRGSITWALDPFDQVLSVGDPRLSDPEFEVLIERYTYQVASGDRILCWDFGRYLNHSCDPSCSPTGLGWEVALRDIAAGEELTNDYAAFNLERAFTCLCGATGCRGEVRPEDLEDQAPRWDERVRAVLPEVLEVLQPLWDQLADPAQVQRVARGPDQLLTLATLRYKAFVKDVAAGARK